MNTIFLLQQWRNIVGSSTYLQGFLGLIFWRYFLYIYIVYWAHALHVENESIVSTLLDYKGNHGKHVQ